MRLPTMACSVSLALLACAAPAAPSGEFPGGTTRASASPPQAEGSAPPAETMVPSAARDVATPLGSTMPSGSPPAALTSASRGSAEETARCGGRCGDDVDVSGVTGGKTRILFAQGSDVAERAIARALQQARGRVRRCYDAGLHRNAQLRGDVVVTLRLDATGKVLSSQSDSSTLPDAGVVACVVEAFRVTSFLGIEGHCTGEVQVSHTLSLAPP